MQGKRDPNPKMNVHPGLSFSREEYLRRFRLVMDGIREGGVDALLVRGPENMTFHLVSGVLIPGEFGSGARASVRVTATGCEVLTSLPLQLYEH